MVINTSLLWTEETREMTVIWLLLASHPWVSVCLGRKQCTWKKWWARVGRQLWPNLLNCILSCQYFAFSLSLLYVFPTQPKNQSTSPWMGQSVVSPECPTYVLLDYVRREPTQGQRESTRWSQGLNCWCSLCKARLLTAIPPRNINSLQINIVKKNIYISKRDEFWNPNILHCFSISRVKMQAQPKDTRMEYYS